MLNQWKYVSDQVCIRRLVTALSLLAVIIASSGFSGCGTEVGNGFSGPGANPDDKKKKTAEPRPSSSTQAETAPAEASKEVNDTSPADGAVAQIPVEMDYGILLAPCASPFAENLASPLALTDDAATAVSAVLTGAEWSVAVNNKTIGFASHYGQNPFQVTSLAADRSVRATVYTCSAVATFDHVVLAGISGEIFKRAVTINEGKNTTQLIWYVKAGAVLNDPKVLLRIEIVDSAGTKVLTLK